MDSNNINLKIIIFGTGTVAESFMNIALHLKFKIVGFVDNDTRKQGSCIDGIEVFHPSVIKKNEFDKIVIASSFVEEIEKQILEYGVKKENVLIFPGDNDDRGVVNNYGIPFKFLKWESLILPVTEKCNLFCSHCYRIKGVHNSGWEISPENFDNLLSKFNPKQFRQVFLAGDGEPTLAKNFKYFLYSAKNKGWNNLSIITNGTWKNYSFLEEIVRDNLLSFIEFSIEGGSKDSFEKWRGFNFDTFVKFLSELNRLKNKYNSNIKLFFNATCGKNNLSEMPAIIDLAIKYNIDLVRIGSLVSLFENGREPEGKFCVEKNLLSSTDPEKIRSVFNQVKDMATKNEIVVNLPSVNGLNDYNQNSNYNNKYSWCSDPFKMIKVDKDGDLFPCCPMNKSFPLKYY